ncbi:teichoic acid transport system permease protein [Haloactinopolyspora alba]|uniref:Teichoic acid transport system permease protein n=1 Tax=Haloactinopolyspora alba TaxID=648780 RepID=A0A2P8E0X2_9ACTN|nr:ABC transporter permease [Haloactinopolyspora alba]PSL03122.1 teichoic acid transport system permease protein [Haloactinopolyspora alba]
MNATRLDEDFTSSTHVYEPHRAGLPRFGKYFRALWQRREFIRELSRTSMRAANTLTVFGQIWLVLNPLLLAMVYFTLVFIIRGTADSDFLAHLVASIFAFTYFGGILRSGASSVTGGGKLLMNTSFPRLLLPLTEVRTAFFRFLPTLGVYLVLHIATGQAWDWTMLLAPYFVLTLTLFGAGMGMIFATAQVYFRDTASFLPYMVRLWLYTSPILWYPWEGQARIQEVLGDVAWLLYLNPLYSMLGGWSESLVRTSMPDTPMLIFSAAWSLVAIVTGVLFFMSKEREFVVRL